MDINNPFPLIGRHLRLIIGVTLLVTGLAYAGSYLFSPSYSATAKVLVRAREARFLTSSGQNLSNQPGVIDSSLAKSLGETNSGLVTSRDVATRIVTDLGLDRPRPQDSSILGQIRSGMKKVYNVAKALIAHGFYTEPSSPFEAAVLDVQNSLSATPIKDSYLIDIKASADTPDLAAAIANSAAAALEGVNKDRYEADAKTYQSFLQGQVDKANADVQAAQATITAYKQANNITVVSEQLKLSANSQEQLRQDLRQTNVDLDAATAKLESLQRSLANTDDTNSTTTTVQSGRSQTTTTATSPSQLHQDLLKELSDTKAQIASLNAQRDALAASLVTPDTNTGLLPAQEAKLNELELALSTREDAYRAVRASYDNAALNSAQGADEVTQVDHASGPLYPDKPVRWMFALLGLVLGAAAAFGLAWFVDTRASSRGAAPLAEPITEPVPPLPPARARGPVPERVLLSRAHEQDPKR